MIPQFFYNDLQLQLCWISPVLKCLWTCDILRSQQVKLGLSMCAICPRISIQTHIRYDAFRQAERVRFKVVFLFGEGEKNPGCLVPRSVPRSGENPVVKKSQHKSPLIFFYTSTSFLRSCSPDLKNFALQEAQYNPTNSYYTQSQASSSDAGF